ncbi:hypothetical protein, partial [Myxococcus sp. AM011]|uniref:hypothetical protein n=1 Tax=Myxococcus sp. AM011 TaxID=2745200 RepID=UPI001C3E7423
MVTTGPGRISTTSPTMPKSASFARSFSAVGSEGPLDGVQAELDGVEAAQLFRAEDEGGHGGAIYRSGQD